MAALFISVGDVAWWQVAAAILLIAVSSTFIGLLIAVSVSEVFEAQTFSKFFRFPMVFLCGLFFPVASLPVLLRPMSLALPLTYGADLLHGAVNGTAQMPITLDLAALVGFCFVLFLVSLRNVRRKWIA
jgi:ABC-2 type transport system permease protein